MESRVADESNLLRILPLNAKNRGGGPHGKEKGNFDWFLEAKLHLCDESFAVNVQMLFFLEVDHTLLLFGFSLPFEGQFVIFQREGLAGFCPAFCSATVEVDFQNHMYHFEAINWIGTHWRGTRRRSPVKGVNSVINFCL